MADRYYVVSLVVAVAILCAVFFVAVQITGADCELCLTDDGRVVR